MELKDQASPNIQRTSNVIDLGFAAASFACVLEILGLGSSGQTPNTTRAVEYFAVSIPVLIGSTIIKSTIISYFELLPHAWHSVVILCFELIEGIATIGCFVGIYWVFRAISYEACSLFLKASLFTAGAAILIVKVMAAIEFERRRRKKMLEKMRA